MVTKQAKNTLQTKCGAVLHLRAIPNTVMEMALRKVETDLRKQGVQVDPPGFNVIPDLPGGVKGDPQWFAYTESTLDVEGEPKLSAENHARWAAYQQGQATLDNAKGVRRVELYLLYGVEVEGGVPGVPEPADGDQKIADYQAGLNDGSWMDDPNYWQTVSRMFGADLPTAPLEIKARWLTERGLTDQEMGGLISDMVGLQVEGALSPDDLETFRRSIRAQVADGIRSRFIGAVAQQERTVDAPTDG